MYVYAYIYIYKIIEKRLAINNYEARNIITYYLCYDDLTFIYYFIYLFSYNILFYLHNN